MKNTAFATAYNADMLEAIFSANNWGDTEIICPDGTPVLVTPCTYGEVASRDDVDYYLVYADIPWMGCDSLEKLAKELNEHADALKKQEASRARLLEYFKEHEASGWDDDSWGFYSDWHKDEYGYRPHGHVCGVYVEPYKGACISNEHSEYTKATVIRAE